MSASKETAPAPHTEGVRWEILVEIRSLPERDWGGTGGNGKRAGEVVTARGQPRGEREEWRRRRESGGESGGRLKGGHSEWPERVGERRGFPKVGLVWVFLRTHVGTVGSLEKPYE